MQSVVNGVNEGCCLPQIYFLELLWNVFFVKMLIIVLHRCAFYHLVFCRFDDINVCLIMYKFRNVKSYCYKRTHYNPCNVYNQCGWLYTMLHGIRQTQIQQPLYIHCGHVCMLCMCVQNNTWNKLVLQIKWLQLLKFQDNLFAFLALGMEDQGSQIYTPYR